MMCEMSFRGQLAIVVGSGVKVILTGVCLSIIYLVLQYVVACTIAGKNPLRCLWNIVPAYLTGFLFVPVRRSYPSPLSVPKRWG